MQSLKLLILSLCTIVASARFNDYSTEGGQVDPPQPTALPDSIDTLLARLLYLPVPDSKGQIAGYYSFISNELLARVFPLSNNQQILQALSQRGLFPITDTSGRLLGFFSSAVGGSQQQLDAQSLTTKLYDLGLFPLENGQGKVVAIYSTRYSAVFGPNGFYNSLQTSPSRGQY